MRRLCTARPLPPRFLGGLALALWLAPAMPQAAAPEPEDDPGAQLCPDIHFDAYSTVESGGQRIAESITWDRRQQAYLIRGPQLARMLDYPGDDQVPAGTPDAQTLFRISIRQRAAPPVNRFCQEHFQERAECSAHGEILYTQLYTDCDLQTSRHVVRISADHAGSLALLVLSFADVRGEFSHPLYLPAGSDLRLATMDAHR